MKNRHRSGETQLKDTDEELNDTNNGCNGSKNSTNAPKDSVDASFITVWLFLLSILLTNWIIIFRLRDILKIIEAFKAYDAHARQATARG